MKTRNWQKLQEFQNENKDLLIMFACPQEDAISVSFGGMNGFVKFPKPESFDKGVIINALRESKFSEAIDAFMLGLTEGTGISVDDPNGLQIAHVVGGAMRSIGIEKTKIGRKALEDFNKKPNAKNKKSKVRR